MNIDNTLQVENNLNKGTDLVEKQNSFLDGFLGQAINKGLDFGIRAVLPDFIEDQIINIKDTLLKYGLKDGISKTIENAINFGKSAIGIVSRNFEDIDQMQSAIKEGNLIEGISNVFNSALDQAEVNNDINTKTINKIKQGENIIIDNVENNVEKNIDKQLKSYDNLNGYLDKWMDFYNNKDFDNMEKQYKKIKKELKNLMPIENTINKARAIENIHTLIKTNGHNFDLSETEKELLKKFQN